MSVRSILQSFDTWRACAAPLVLATVYETQGSTYSKAGQRILIAADGDYRGLVSGGCLEGDLAERARTVAASDRPSAVTYDLRDAADELWGLGIGCNGLLRVFLQPLHAAQSYQPFAAIAECLRSTATAGSATVIDSSDPALPTGTTVICRSDAHAVFGAVGTVAERVLAGAQRAATEECTQFVTEFGSSVLYAPLRPIPKLLVLGAGLDAVPLVAMAAELGWFVTVADHRPAYVARPGFERAERVVLVEAAAVAAALPLDDFDAVVVMSHHLPTDRTYLAQLAAASCRYVGVLGPRARRDRLLADLGAAGTQLRNRLKGPVGLDIGADSPESIALSILAELQTMVGNR